MALKNLFIKDTRIIISWEERYAKIQLVYNDLVAPYKTIAEHWEHFDSLKQYFKDENASYAIISPSQFTPAMKSIENLKTEYGSNKKMCFIIDDKVQSMHVLETPPEGYVIKYILSGSDLIRKLPDQAIECEDGWSVWKDSIWHLPKLSSTDLNGFRRTKIPRDELIKFLKEDLPLYNSAGQEIECDISNKDEKACTIEISRVERDSIDLIVKWAVPLDSVDPEFDIFGYILSDNTVYSGLNPLEIEQYCPNVTGKNSLTFTKIATFLDEVYPKWQPWISGDTNKFESIHHWLKPPFHSFLKVDYHTKDGIGQAIGQPYILIGNECLSANIIKDALSSEYYHLRKGWIKVEDLKSSIRKQIIDDPMTSMATTPLTGNKVLHLGDNLLKEKWQDILFTEKIQWYTGGTKTSIASAHFEYLFKQGTSGGLSGGYEAFMAYGLSFLIEYLNHNQVKPIILLGSEYKTTINTTIENTPILKNSEIDVITYNHLTQYKLTKNRIGIVIEPEEILNLPPISNILYSSIDNCDLCLCFTAKKPTAFTGEERKAITRLLKTDYTDDLPYLIRDVHEPHDAPTTTKFTEDLRLPFTNLIYHEKYVDLN